MFDCSQLIMIKRNYHQMKCFNIPPFNFQVSLRKQEIADRLSAWTIFNDKNKEFCDWLMQMENKVNHNVDLSIEEMVEKLKKVDGHRHR